MLAYYEKLSIEAPIRKSHVAALTKAMVSLDGKYGALIHSTLKRFLGVQKTVCERENLLRSWLEAPYRGSFTLEVFTPSADSKLCLVVELREISSLETPFGKRYRTKCQAYLLVYVFSETKIAMPTLAGFNKELQKEIRKVLGWKNPPRLRPVWRINDTFEALRKKTQQFKEPTKSIKAALGFLKCPSLRTALIRARQAKDPTIANIATSLGLSTSAVRPTISKASKNGLLYQEYNVVCSKCGQVIARVKDMSAIRTMANNDVTCASCHSAVKATSFEKAYTLNSKIAPLLDGSKWMSLYVGETLVSLGITSKNILTEFTDGPNEIDILVNADGELLLLELKDSVFSIGHAYSFAGKCSLYKPNFAVIVSTQGIDKDVKEYVEKTEIKGYYIESLSCLEDDLKPILSERYENIFARLINQIPWNQLLWLSLSGRFGVTTQPEALRHPFYISP